MATFSIQYSSQKFILEEPFLDLEICPVAVLREFIIYGDAIRVQTGPVDDVIM